MKIELHIIRTPWQLTETMRLDAAGFAERKRELAKTHTVRELEANRYLAEPLTIEEAAAAANAAAIIETIMGEPK